MYRLLLLLPLFGCPPAAKESTPVVEVVDDDGDGFGEPEDCGPGNAAVHPGATELCDGIDNNCDGTIDEGVTTSFYADQDQDGFGDPEVIQNNCLQPSGFVALNTDCDDQHASMWPGNPESCDGLDNNCDGTVDEGVGSSWYADGDGDGFGDGRQTFTACEVPTGYTGDATDCDDGNVNAYPGNTEICDGADNNCDGQVDEDAATDAPLWYDDRDEDGYGDPDRVLAACDAPWGFVAANGDCDDLEPLTYPGAPETCDGADNNCDGTTDEGVTRTFYVDADGDGHGDPAVPVSACGLPAGASTRADDCDDTASSVFPGATERCNGVDDDCDGTVDVGAVDGRNWYADGDGDGHGDPAVVTESCSAPVGYIADSSDCDDGDAAIHPGAAEACNGLDDDCNGQIDDGAGLPGTYYADADADGFGNATVSVQACTRPSGFVSDASDCDDTDPDIFPGADEACNGLDDDCDGLTDENAIDALPWYVDGDGDGYGDPSRSQDACTAPVGSVATGDDCQDADPAIHPNAQEVCNGVDDDCDGTIDTNAVDAGTWYADGDGDGYGDLSLPQSACGQPSGTVADASDCDDVDSAVHPNAVEHCDGIDNNCDGATDDLGVCACPSATYNGHDYFFCTSTTDWSTAENTCAADGKHLAHINDSAENSWLYGQVNTINSNISWWIGYNDISSEGSFVWTDGGANSYANWYYGEPNNSGNEDCTEFNSHNRVGFWNDLPCSLAVAYICEG